MDICYLVITDLDRIQSCLCKSYKWGFTNARYNVRELFEIADYNLFKSASNNPYHCMHGLLPSKRDMHGRQLRSRAHNFQLSQIGTVMFKNAFVNRCLFNSCLQEYSLVDSLIICMIVNVANFCFFFC